MVEKWINSVIFGKLSPEEKGMTALPSEVIMEVTNHCNLNCRMCHFHSPRVEKRREKGFIEERLWRKIIDEIGGWGKEVNLATYGAGEPLLHPRLFEIIEYAGSKKNIRVGFLSNGTLLDENKIEMIFKTGVDWCGFSIDGTDPILFAGYRSNAGLSVVEERLYKILAKKKRQRSLSPQIKLNMVVFPGMEKMVDEYLEKWVAEVDEVMISKFRPLGKRTFLNEPVKRYPCPLLNRTMVITWRGEVALCCEDIFAEMIMGDGGKRSLAGIWQGSKFRKVRKIHQLGKYDTLPLCAQCDTWSTDKGKTVLLKDKNWLVTTNTAQSVYARVQQG